MAYLRSSYHKVSEYTHEMDLDATNPVFGVSDQVIPKPACSATETSENGKLSLVASLDMILSKEQITKALIRLRGCAGLYAPLLFANTEDRFFCVEAKITKLWDQWLNSYDQCFCLFDLILYVPSTKFQLNRDGSPWVEPVLS